MRRIEEFATGARSPDRVIRAYWDARIDDTPLSQDGPGKRGFFAAREAYRRRKNPYLEQIVDFAGWRDRDVLDLGCGAGLDLVRYARGGARVTGVDVSPVALGLARDHCVAAGVSATLLEGDGARLPLPDGSFDLVWCHGVLSFVRDPAAVVAEAHRVLRPGGRAILMVYNRRSWMQWLLRLPGAPVGRGHADAPAFRTWTRAELERWLPPLQLERVAIERPPPLPGVLQPVVERWLRPWGWHLLAICRKPGG